MMGGTELEDFVRESNRIEGIHRHPTDTEVRVHMQFLELPEIRLVDLRNFVHIVQPDAVLRETRDLNVRVGRHTAPPGGPEIRHKLEAWLEVVNFCKNDRRFMDQWQLHADYLVLHPFTDGNGRSARALWLWTMDGEAPLGFLHEFYYQTLDRWSPLTDYVR